MYAPDSLLYKDSDAMRTLLRRLPLANLAIQSTGPQLVNGTEYHQSPLDLLKTGEHYENLAKKDGEKRGDSNMLYTHSAINLCRIYGLNNELLMLMAQATDRNPDRLTLPQLLVEMRARFIFAQLTRRTTLPTICVHG